MRRDNRAALLEGARRCLDEHGYARTRARDVAAAAEVSLAAIGYHFGTTDALLVTALMEALDEWSSEVADRIDDLPEGTEPAGRWAVVLSSLPAYRGVLAASYELIARADEVPEVASRLRVALDAARVGAAHQLAALPADTEPDRVVRAGHVAYAILSGVIVQWLVDESRLPDAASLLAGLADLVGS